MEFNAQGAFNNPEHAGYLASTAIEIIDALPPPRRIELSDDVEAAWACMAGFGIKSLVTAFEAPDTAESIRVADVIIEGLRSAGVRVGPFRERKINKIISLG